MLQKRSYQSSHWNRYLRSEDMNTSHVRQQTTEYSYITIVYFIFIHAVYLVQETEKPTTTAIVHVRVYNKPGRILQSEYRMPCAVLCLSTNRCRVLPPPRQTDYQAYITVNHTQPDTRLCKCDFVSLQRESRGNPRGKRQSTRPYPCTRL